MSELESDGVLDRRELLRRGAIVGGTLVWAAPTVQAFAKPAFAQTGSPPPGAAGGKGFSYVVVCYTSSGPSDHCCVKFDLDDDGNDTECDGPNDQGVLRTPQCGTDDEVMATCGDCSLFDVSSPDSGLTIIVSFHDSTTGTFTGGFGKCGNSTNDNSGGECVDGTISPDGSTITFADCGTGTH